MADVDERGERRLAQTPEMRSQPETDSARIAAPSEVKAAQALNKNAHNGSAGGDQNQSIEIVLSKDGGGYDVLASRNKAQDAKPEPLTVDFLKARTQQGDIWAGKFMTEIESAKRLPEGATQDYLIETVLKKAQVVFRPEETANAQQKPESEEQDQTNTGTIIAKQAEKNPALEPVKALYNWANSLEPGAEKDKHQQLAKEQLIALESETKGALDALERRRQLAAEQEECGVHEVPQSRKYLIQGQISYPEKEIEGVRRLTPDDLSKLATAMKAAGPAAEESINQTTREILVRTGESSRDTMLAGINLVVGLLKYDRDLLVNPEQARENASKAGEALGLLLVAGVQIGVGVAGAAEETKQSGDYSLPLRRTGEALNRWYEKQTPADQMAVAAEISAGFGLGAFGAEANKLRKPGAFTAFLKEGLEVLPRNPEAERKALEALAGVLKGRQALKEAAGIGAVEQAGEVVKEAQEKGLTDNIMAMVRYFEHGKKKSVSGEYAAQKAGVTKNELKNMTETQLEAHGLESIQKSYDRLFFTAYPNLKDTGVVVHHALPQMLLDKHRGHAGLFKAKEVNSLEYLRGIPRTAMKDGEWVHDSISERWRQFLPRGRKVTREQVLEELRAIDKEFGQYFVPPM